MVVTSAVEGLLETAVARRLISHQGAVAGPVYGERGRQFLLARLTNYNKAARHAPWLVLTDLEADECAPVLRARTLPDMARLMCFRISVRATESWLMADADHLAHFLSVPRARVPADPEALESPKDAMVNLARHSARGDLRAEMVPSPGTRRRTGPAYTSRLIAFVNDRTHGWRPDVAAASSDSLKRCLERTAELLVNAQAVVLSDG